MDDYTAYRFLWFSLLTLFQVLQAQWPLTPGVNTNAVHKWMYINERKSICKMHIGYVILYVLMFNARKVRISFLGPCTHLDRTVLTMLQHKMPNVSWTSRFLKWSARTDFSTNELSTNEIKTSCFYLFIYLSSVPINGRLSARLGQNVWESSARTVPLKFPVL